MRFGFTRCSVSLICFVLRGSVGERLRFLVAALVLMFWWRILTVLGRKWVVLGVLRVG